MDLELTAEQQMIIDGIGTILGRMAGPERCRVLLEERAYDDALEKVLWDQGYLGMYADPEAGPLEAVLMVEQVAKALGTVATGALAVVGPALGVPELRGPVGLSLGPPRNDIPIRYAVASGSLLMTDQDEAFLCEVVDGQPLPTAWSYPAAQVTIGARRSLGPGTSDRMIAWWRVTIAAEIVGNASACLDVLLGHIKERYQFGRSLATLQALQHRLAQLFVLIEGGRWLAYRAAWSGAPSADAALAAADSVAAGRRTVRECHQICGALGLTTEFDLHLWTMRIRALCGEAGGLYAAQADAGRLRWRGVGFIGDHMSAADGESVASAPELLYEKDGYIATIILNRPHRGNALTPTMHEQIRGIWGDIQADDDIRVAIITGAGDRHFSTGADVNIIADRGRVSQGSGPLRNELFWSSRQANVLKPVICAVNGLCAGAGLHFVADADIVLASPNASFMDTHVNVGMVGGVENTALAYRLPLGSVLRMTLMGKGYRMPVARAYELGLVDEVIAADQLMEGAFEMAAVIAENSPAAVQRSKQAIWQSREVGYEHAVEYGWAMVRMHWGHPDFLEGPAAFREKRPPKWAKI